MPKGSKEAYTSKQKRQAEHIEEGYKKRGVSAKTAAARAWATVNKESGGGKKSGSGRGKPRKTTSSAKGGRKAAAKKAATKRAGKSTSREATARRSSQ
jgi:plasmid stabilization system protein ParE